MSNTHEEGINCRPEGEKHFALCKKLESYGFCEHHEYKAWMNNKDLVYGCYIPCVCYSHPEHACCPQQTTTTPTTTVTLPTECLPIFETNSVGTVVEISSCYSLECNFDHCGNLKWRAVRDSNNSCENDCQGIYEPL